MLRTQFDARGDPYVKTTVRIHGCRQIEACEAMCAVLGRQPHQLAADMVLDGIRNGQRNKSIQSVAEPLRKLRRGRRKSSLRLVSGGTDGH